MKILNTHHTIGKKNMMERVKRNQTRHNKFAVRFCSKTRAACQTMMWFYRHIFLISTKAFDEVILQNIGPWGMVFWKIVCVLTNFWGSSPGKFIRVLIILIEEFLSLHSSLLENLMCSRNLFKKVASIKKRTHTFAKQFTPPRKLSYKHFTNNKNILT